MLAALAAACGDSDAAPSGPGKTEGAWAAPTTWPARAKTTAAPAGNDKLVPVPKEIAAGVQLVEVATGLSRPVALVAAPGDARKRLFIVEQHAGTIRILEKGKVAPAPFLTVKGVSTGNEQGLLGLAFHPKFAANGKLYVYYTTRDLSLHIVEYKVSAKNPDLVDEATKRELIEIAHPYSNHNGGNLLFGPDGKLYAGTGDGGSAGDPKKNGQNDKALLAKILKFDVDAANPAPEIVAMGVRNPWRFSFDEKTRGLYIGDVGQNLWEYVWVVPYDDNVRRNFGWNVVEGSHCFNAATCTKTGFTPPAAEYSHDEGCSITGGFVYRGKALPKLDGRYFYADYCTGLLRSFTWTPDDSSPTAPGFVRDHWNWKSAIDRGGQLYEISSFGVDHDGELYILKLTGTVFKLAPKS
ncbi:MAG: PQQ-dependent sugar dehydrogenase [Deltaproteobacteria bacterium]|nr:PQQ-dependent sugar dehydrogenase [Deltaproteobacteria bacterium]